MSRRNTTAQQIDNIAILCSYSLHTANYHRGNPRINGHFMGFYRYKNQSTWFGMCVNAMTFNLATKERKFTMDIVNTTFLVRFFNFNMEDDNEVNRPPGG